jgi:glycerol kinase
LWNLTGGVDGGQHITDVTNASRTMLMDLETLDWDSELLSFFGIPRPMLPTIVPSSHATAYQRTRPDGPFGGEVIIGGDLGDQQAAMVGQVCLSEAEAKNTYGTGNFLLLNTGEKLCRSANGLLSTVCFQFGDAPPVYALEGSIAVTGSAVQWLRDQLKIINDASEIETLASQVDSAAQVYFVPAFSGLFAPYWRSDARGVIVGLSRFHTREHIARATLEAICYQSRDVMEAMEKDAGVEVSKPVVPETTALGAAYAAGMATGFWSSAAELRENWLEDQRWTPQISEDERAAGYEGWKKAVTRTLDWVQVE